MIRGQAETGRVITAASLIMILVFASFIIGGQMPIQQIGLGFAAAIFVDAYLIRTVLVPAVMHMLGRANWWLPALAGPGPAPPSRGACRADAGRAAPPANWRRASRAMRGHPPRAQPGRRAVT